MSNWTYHWVPVNMKRGYLRKKKTWWFWCIFWKPIGHGQDTDRLEMCVNYWNCVVVDRVSLLRLKKKKKRGAVYCGDWESGVLRGWAMNVEVNVEVSEWSERWSLSALEGFNINLDLVEWVAARCQSYRDMELGVFLLMKGMYHYFSRKRNTGVGQQEEGKIESLLNYVYLKCITVFKVWILSYVYFNVLLF